jgi:predicted HTH domain antitoxin
MINTIRDRNYGRLRQLPHIDQLKVRRALEMYQIGADSLGYAAEKTGLSKRDLIREAHTRGIEPPFDEQTVCEELGLWTLV